jgi:molybdopterin-guanine dinucleotide biosynthesis protein MobB
LVVDLLHELTGRGFRLATVKHAHHEFDIDHPGKDSHQHREAGAEEVIVASARRWAHIKELIDEPEPALADLLRHIGDVDLVLVEGYKHGDHPRWFAISLLVPALSLLQEFRRVEWCDLNQVTGSDGANPFRHDRPAI